jgi:hypothetical protein
MGPTRVIEGQATKLGRTLHGIAYNRVSDEIVVGNPLASSILVFRGGASGNVPPLRVIQGPSTKLVFPHAVSLDVVNKEIIVLDTGARALLVFAGDANGDVAPLRVLKGPKTMIEKVVGAAVDHERDLLVVTSTNTARIQPGIFIFNRTANGDVAPKAVIAGPRTRIENNPRQLEVHDGKIYAAIENGFYSPLYTNIQLRKIRRDGSKISKDMEILSPWRTDRVGFIGVWKITDNGDVAPLAIINGPSTGVIHAGGIALNPKDKEIFVVDTVRNGLLTFLLPEFFN